MGVGIDGVGGLEGWRAGDKMLCEVDGWGKVVAGGGGVGHDEPLVGSMRARQNATHAVANVAANPFVDAGALVRLCFSEKKRVD